jgi:hypothetical protein
MATMPAFLHPARPGVAVRGHARRVLMMGAPRKKLPDRTVQVHCAGCNTLLYKYAKGGKGSLVKCYQGKTQASRW